MIFSASGTRIKQIIWLKIRKEKERTSSGCCQQVS